VASGDGSLARDIGAPSSHETGGPRSVTDGAARASASSVGASPPVRPCSAMSTESGFLSRALAAAARPAFRQLGAARQIGV
jgi:hypothetical protein